MTNKNSDHVFDGLVHRSIVPMGFRPETDAEIEAMLEGLGSGELSDEKRRRMLAKIRGDMPMSWDESESDPAGKWQATSAEEREFAEMFRSEGDDLPPELEEKLREMEQRAAEPPDEDEDHDAK